MSTQQRPLGVTLISIIFLFSAAVAVFIVVRSAQDPDWLSRTMETISAGSPGPTMITYLGSGIVWVAAAIGLVMGGLGMGLWAMRPWARTATLAVLVVSLVAVIGLLAATHGQLSAFWMAVVGVRFVALVVFGWYLLRPQVAAAFR